MKQTKLSGALTLTLHLSEMIFKEKTGFRFVNFVGEAEKLSTVKQIALFFNEDTKSDLVLEVKKLLRNKEIEIYYDDEHLHLTFNDSCFTKLDIDLFEVDYSFL